MALATFRQARRTDVERLPPRTRRAQT